jgi:tetratricopeptide (TPR) repeat protein
MKRLLPVLCLVCTAAVGGTTWVMLRSGVDLDVAVPSAPGGAANGDAANEPFAADLDRARRTCTPTALDAVVAALRAATSERGEDRHAWHLLAEACLERALVRSHHRGMSVGTPTWRELPTEVAADLDRGLAAAARARELGDDSADLFRIEAGLLGQRITGLGTALQWNGKIKDALQAASQRGADDPRLHVSLGLRKLLAPKLLGHDPNQALEHFEFAAKALARDERPAVFAAMASYLLKKRQQAIGWLEQATARNPANTFARVVLRRLQAGEAQPFERDVTAAEAAAK